jgi:hypothetical protein
LPIENRPRLPQPSNCISDPRKASGARPRGARTAAPSKAIGDAHHSDHQSFRATLVQCRLETRRQHQIRIQMAELGHPLVGERVYIRDYLGRRIQASRTMLHAATLGFVNPTSGDRVMFEQAPPDDLRAMMKRLGGASAISRAGSRTWSSGIRRTFRFRLHCRCHCP